MFNFTIIVFVAGWVLWFAIDKHPASLGTILPHEQETLLANFQLAFDMLSAGYLRASYAFIWQAHYIILSLLFALLLSALFQAFSKAYRQRRLQLLMWPKKLTPQKNEPGKPEPENSAKQATDDNNNS